MNFLSSLWNEKGLRKKHQGYSGARPDVLRLVEGFPLRILDVGCGAGVLGNALIAASPDCTVTGVEPDEVLATIAREHMHQVIVGRIDDSATLERIANLGPYDLVICADVLEHLADPDDVLACLVGMLSEQGRVITSIPNIRHVSTFISLGLFGTWPARERGIHDRTHLRFFARSDILSLGSRANLVPLREARNLRLVEALAWTMIPAKFLDFWPFRPFLTFQYLHCWKRREVS